MTCWSLLLITFLGCSKEPPVLIQTVTGPHYPGGEDIWLSHEHILVDFIGADHIGPHRWNNQEVIDHMIPYLSELSDHKVRIFVDATPRYLGRDVNIMRKLSQETGIQIVTNTGFYGARQNRYIPASAFEMTAVEMARIWTSEFENGIAGTSIKPGFIKISVDASDPLAPVHSKIVRAAAITHLSTGLVIGSHTGPATGLYPQLDILESVGVSASAFIWIHAQNESDHAHYLEAAARGCWISLDGLGWELDDLRI